MNSLGIIWIPCVGPMLSSVLLMVAERKDVPSGVFLLLIYSLGFALPMLLAAYTSRFFRTRLNKIRKFPIVVNIGSGLILVAFGIVILIRGY